MSIPGALFVIHRLYSYSLPCGPQNLIFMENWKLLKLLEMDAKYPGAVDEFIEAMEQHEKTTTYT